MVVSPPNPGVIGISVRIMEGLAVDVVPVVPVVAVVVAEVVVVVCTVAVVFCSGIDQVAAPKIPLLKNWTCNIF